MKQVDSDREDGEIVDDDEEEEEEEIFEDVSDCSMPSSCHSGKSFTYQDNISIVSLSSISDNEDEPPPCATQYVEEEHPTGASSCRRRKRRSPHHHYDRRRNRHSSSKRYRARSKSTSEEEQLNRTVLRQLKEAVRINSGGAKNNNLKTRLKEMINGKGKSKTKASDDSDDPELEQRELEKLRSDALSTKMVVEKKETIVVGKKVDDQELVELRLAALKSAVIKNHMKRKKKKEQLERKEVESNTGIVSSLEMNKENTMGNEESGNSLDNSKEQLECPEELVMVEKTRKLERTDHLNSTEEDVDIMRAKLLASMSKKITSLSDPVATNLVVAASKQNVIVQSVSAKPFGAHVYKKTLSASANSVNILKMPTVKPLIINLTGDSESDTTDVEECGTDTDKNETIAMKVTELLQKTRAEVEATDTVTRKPNRQIDKSGNDTMDSVLAEKSVVKLLPKSQQQEYRMLKQKLLNAKKKRIRKPSQSNNKAAAGRVNSATESVNVPTRQNADKDIEVAVDQGAIVNERLQMKGKYKELGPLLQKVNQASAQKKKLELRIKELLDELKRARMSLVDSQLNFSKLVKELILKKENLDKRLSKVKATTFKRPLPSSTPVKGAKVEEEIIPLEPLPKVIDELQLGAQEEAAANNNEEKTDKNDFIEYISPLGGVASSRAEKTDPLGTFCPYEIFGVCKDPECTYKHYS